MKKNKVLAVIGICILMVAGCVLSFGEKPEYEGLEKAEEVGQSLQEAANSLADSDSENTLIRIIGDGIEQDVSEEYFSVRVALWKAYGASDPVGSAIDSMKTEALEKAFAEKQGLTPTKMEINEYVKSMREEIQSDEESSAIVEELLQTIGFSQDYYWDEYKPRYEAPAALTHLKVSDYIVVNGLEKIDPSRADYEVIDKEAFEEIRNHYTM